MSLSRSQRLERRLHAAFELTWNEDLPASMSALDRRSRAHFWTTNNAYTLQCLETLASIGGSYGGPVRPCFICTLSSTSSTFPCGHSMCNRCTVNMISQDIKVSSRVCCPFCRTEHFFSNEQCIVLRHASCVYTAQIARHYHFYEEAYFILNGYYPE